MFGERQVGSMMTRRVKFHASFVYSLSLLLGGCGGQESFRVPGGGMEPTIAIGDTITLDSSTYSTSADVVRGDTIVFQPPVTAGGLFVKRVLGLPGERVSVRSGRVEVNDEPFVLLETSSPTEFVEVLGSSRHRIRILPPCEDPPIEVVVPADTFFVLGDNRCASRDSRHFGTIRFSEVRGKAMLER